ncbi:hypothetical protein OSB04_001047 [Centaurea solstitialis]|uniref:Integrase catalytic domain-containing protein n=1 Tax=Centaurea solstitialis TaxID=347529 RepID=A0AA38U2X8_9ASTR|nr:hypothetical protein OSB04_001047 [Centaurea solstitialis]
MAIHPPDQTWYADIGATSHMTNNSGNFTSYVNNGLFRNVIVGDGSPIPIRGIGHQTLPYPFSPLLLKNVINTPRIIKNLLSIHRFTIDNVVSIEFDTDNLYLFKLKSSSQVTHPSTFAAITRDLWHHHLGHPGADVLSTLRSNLCFSSSKKLSSNTFCHSCVLGKQIKFPFSSSNSLTHLPFDIIHTDVWTSPVLSSSGHRYYVLFLDDKTNYMWTYPLANKSQVFSTFLHFFSMIKTQFHYTIKTIQCDNGREFDNQQFHNLCSQTSTQFQFSCPYTSPQNGKVERKIRSINNILRTLLTHSNVPMHLWHHALQHATYLLNILPTKTLANLTPTHLLYNLQPTYTHLKTFGCVFYPLTPSLSIHRLHKRSQPCVFLGHPSNHQGYKCYDINSKTIILSRHMVFDETNFRFLNSHPHLKQPLFRSRRTHTHSFDPSHRPPPTPTAATTHTTPSPPSLQHALIDLDKTHLLRQSHQCFPRQRPLWYLPHQHHQAPLLTLFTPVACRVSQNLVNHLTFHLYLHISSSSKPSRCS